MTRSTTAIIAGALTAAGLGCSVAKMPAGAPPSAPQAAANGEPTFRRSEVTRIIADARKIDTTDGIEELRAIDVGGIKQWISVRGRHRANPILLFVHGGPGSPMMPASWFFQTPWEEYFTVVQWDQRGAGKTAAANDPATVIPTIGADRMIADCEEVIQYLRKTYHKDKVFLLGHSWGTIIGITVAQHHPEWLHGYIAMGQAINSRENERLGYEFALREAKAHANQEAVKELAGIAPYPAADGTVSFDQILLQRKWVITFGGLTWHRSDFDYDQNAAKVSPDYTREDVEALGKNDGASLRQLLGTMNHLEYDKTATTFKCPVFVLAGRYDYETVSEVAKAWFDKLTAPKKAFFWFEHSAHMLPFEEPGRMFLHLVLDVRPVAVAAGDGVGVGN